jgi:hypothetical protein
VCRRHSGSRAGRSRTPPGQGNRYAAAAPFLGVDGSAGLTVAEDRGRFEDDWWWDEAKLSLNVRVAVFLHVRSDAGVGDDSSGGDRLLQQAVVAFVLIGVRDREVDECVVKLL